MAKAQDPLPPEVLAAFQRNEPIQAIKLLLAGRAQARSPSKPLATKQPARPTSQPKSLPLPSVESIASGRSLSPGEVPRSSSSFWAWVVVALLAYVAYQVIHG
jgi:hypothetical protein